MEVYKVGSGKWKAPRLKIVGSIPLIDPLVVYTIKLT
jgi:hypothetical protein